MSDKLTRLIWSLRYSGHVPTKDGKHLMRSKSQHSVEAAKCLKLVLAAINKKNATGGALRHTITHGTLHSSIKTKKVITKLLECGASPKTKDDKGQTALAYAIGYYDDGDEWMLKLLCEHGADINGADIQPALEHRLEMTWRPKFKKLKAALIKLGLEITDEET
ncbi:MAG: hypothetical protein K0U41_03570 [Gammaproteobacteria bacterium]|nr:hypothetical protein [Gammaproteobacteria bacterium]